MGYTPMRQAYHGNEDGKGGDDLGPEPVGRLDVFNPLQLFSKKNFSCSVSSLQLLMYTA